MRSTVLWSSMVVAGSLSLAAGPVLAGDGGKMSFFVTSANPGNGGNFGGIEGADKHCQALAAAAGAGGRTWHAYLSTQGAKLTDTDVVHARDRIGAGPWYNAKGVMIAKSVDDLHSPNNNITKETALDEKGQPIPGRGAKPNKHDILTGSRPDGTAFAGQFFPDMTCGNWTKGDAEGSAMTGHSDRTGPVGDPWAKSWNSAHPTRGCNMEAIRSTGGEGFLYCFAVK